MSLLDIRAVFVGGCTKLVRDKEAYTTHELHRETYTIESTKIHFTKAR